MKTKKVRILKSGSHEGIKYNKGEIWDYIEHFTSNIVIIEKKNVRSKVCVNLNNNDYGLEAEIIEEDVIEQSKELTINLW